MADQNGTRKISKPRPFKTWLRGYNCCGPFAAMVFTDKDWPRGVKSWEVMEAHLTKRCAPQMFSEQHDGHLMSGSESVSYFARHGKRRADS